MVQIFYFVVLFYISVTVRSQSQSYSFTIRTSDPNILSQVQSLIADNGVSTLFENVGNFQNGGLNRGSTLLQNIGQLQNIRQGNYNGGSSLLQNIGTLQNGGQGQFQRRIISTSRPVRRRIVRINNNSQPSTTRNTFFIRNGGQPQNTRTQIVRSDNPGFRRTMFWIEQPSINQRPTVPRSITPNNANAEEMAGNFGIPTRFQKYILDFHNAKRSASNAADMYALKWNNQLAQESYDWATQCNWGHQEAGRGENLAYVTGGGLQVLLDYGLKGWYDEIKQYDGNNCMDTGSCHYTQMVWSSTTEVGCAAHRCPDMHYLVCFYSPPGNIIGIPPFQTGTPCSACSGTCRNNLCYW